MTDARAAPAPAAHTGTESAGLSSGGGRPRRPPPESEFDRFRWNGLDENVLAVLDLEDHRRLDGIAIRSDRDLARDPHVVLRRGDRVPQLRTLRRSGARHRIGED